MSDNQDRLAALLRGDDFDRVEIMGRIRALEGGNRTAYERELQGVVRALAAELEATRRQLKAVDESLPPWESERAPDSFAVGRVQTILNLRADRAELEATREALREARRERELAKSFLTHEQSDAYFTALAGGEQT